MNVRIQFKTNKGIDGTLTGPAHSINEILGALKDAGQLRSINRGAGWVDDPSPTVNAPITQSGKSGKQAPLPRPSSLVANEGDGSHATATANNAGQAKPGPYKGGKQRPLARPSSAPN